MRKYRLTPITSLGFQSDKEISDLSETIPSDENVDYQEWKRVKVTEGGKAKSRIRLVNSTIKKNEFVKIMKADVNSFKEHADRIKKQYRNFKSFERYATSKQCHYAHRLCRELQMSM